MTYTKALDALDLKYGRVHTVDDWRRAGDKSQHAPETLTSDDLTIIEGFSGAKAMQDAIARRDAALNPPSPDPPAVTKRAAPARRPVEFPKKLWDNDAPDIPKAIEEWATANRMKAVPVFLWHALVAGGRERRQALEQKVATLETRLATLEAKPHVKFCGTWERGKTYEPGNAVVRDGGLWICKAPTPGDPSKDFVGWQLAVRKGSV